MPLGPKYYEVGIYAGFASAIYGQLVAGLFGGAAHPGSGPRAATTLILAALVATARRRSRARAVGDAGSRWSSSRSPAPPSCSPGVAPDRAGRARRRQLRALRAVPVRRRLHVRRVRAHHRRAVRAARRASRRRISRPDRSARGRRCSRRRCSSASPRRASSGWSARHGSGVPAPLLGLIAGSLLYYAIAFAASRRSASGRSSAPAPGLAARSRPRSLRSRSVPWDAIEAHWRIIVPTAGLIAFIGTLDGLFAAVAIDNVTDGRHRTKREVVAHGFANVVSGLCGGVPVVLSRAVALASWNAGGRTTPRDRHLRRGPRARARVRRPADREDPGDGAGGRDDHARHRADRQLDARGSRAACGARARCASRRCCGAWRRSRWSRSPRSSSDSCRRSPSASSCPASCSTSA